MTLQDQIKAELKKAGLPETLAALLNVTKEDDIKNVIDGLKAMIPGSVDDLLTNPLFEHLKGQYQNMKTWQSEGDKKIQDAIRTYEKTLREKFDFTEKGGKGDEPQNEKFSQLEKLINDQKAMIDGFMNSQKSQKIQANLLIKLAEKKIPARFAQGISVDDESKIDDVIKGIEAEYLGIRQEIINSSFEGDPQRISKGEPADTDIKEFAEGRNKPGGSLEADGIIGKKIGV
jgi:hypothetical protein